MPDPRPGPPKWPPENPVGERGPSGGEPYRTPAGDIWDPESQMPVGRWFPPDGTPEPPEELPPGEDWWPKGVPRDGPPAETMDEDTSSGGFPWDDDDVFIPSPPKLPPEPDPMPPSEPSGLIWGPFFPGWEGGWRGGWPEPDPPKKKAPGKQTPIRNDDGNIVHPDGTVEYPPDPYEGRGIPEPYDRLSDGVTQRPRVVGGRWKWFWEWTDPKTGNVTQVPETVPSWPEGWEPDPPDEPTDDDEYEYANPSGMFPLRRPREPNDDESSEDETGSTVEGVGKARVGRQARRRQNGDGHIGIGGSDTNHQRIPFGDNLRSDWREHRRLVSGLGHRQAHQF